MLCIQSCTPLYTRCTVIWADKPTGRQTTGRQSNWATDNWATHFGQLGDNTRFRVYWPSPSARFSCGHRQTRYATVEKQDACGLDECRELIYIRIWSRSRRLGLEAVSRPIKASTSVSSRTDWRTSLARNQVSRFWYRSRIVRPHVHPWVYRDANYFATRPEIRSLDKCSPLSASSASTPAAASCSCALNTVLVYKVCESVRFWRIKIHIYSQGQFLQVNCG